MQISGTNILYKYPAQRSGTNIQYKYLDIFSARHKFKIAAVHPSARSRWLRHIQWFLQITNKIWLDDKSTWRFSLESWRSPIWKQKRWAYICSVISNLYRFAVVVYLPVLVHPQAVNVGVQDHLQQPNCNTREVDSMSPQRMESSDWIWAKCRPSLCRMFWADSPKLIWTWLPAPTSPSSWPLRPGLKFSFLASQTMQCFYQLELVLRPQRRRAWSSWSCGRWWWGAGWGCRRWGWCPAVFWYKILVIFSSWICIWRSKSLLSV